MEILKVYCKRTYFEKNTNAFPVNGKEYGKDYVKWAWGKLYECREPKDYEKPATYLIIQSEVENMWSPISEKNFNKHFTTLEDYRHRKITEILRNEIPNR